MKEVEFALKTGKGQPETGSVIVDNIESVDEIERAIRSQDNFKSSKGGRPSKIEQWYGPIRDSIKIQEDLETAAHALGRAEKDLSPATFWRLKNKIEMNTETGMISKLQEMKEYEQGKK